MIKNVMLPYKLISSASMTGVTVYTSSASNIMYYDNVAVQLQWTGNPTGVFQVQNSLDYNPGQPQSKGEVQAGTWVPITLNPVPAAVTTATSSWTIQLDDLPFPWVRVLYTNSTGSGVLTGYISGKSKG